MLRAPVRPPLPDGLQHKKPLFQASYRKVRERIFTALDQLNDNEIIPLNLGNRREVRILEIGCGVINVSEYLRARFPGISFKHLALDSEPVCINHAQTIDHHQDTHFECVDASDLESVTAAMQAFFGKDVKADIVLMIDPYSALNLPTPGRRESVLAFWRIMQDVIPKTLVPGGNIIVKNRIKNEQPAASMAIQSVIDGDLRLRNAGSSLIFSLSNTQQRPNPQPLTYDDWERENIDPFTRTLFSNLIYLQEELAQASPAQRVLLCIAAYCFITAFMKMLAPSEPDTGPAYQAPSWSP